MRIGASDLLETRWSDDGRSFLDGVSVGDRVSMHWDWICDVLTPGQSAAIEAYEARQLAVTNQVLDLAS